MLEVKRVNDDHFTWLWKKNKTAASFNVFSEVSACQWAIEVGSNKWFTKY